MSEETVDIYGYEPDDVQGPAGLSAFLNEKVRLTTLAVEKDDEGKSYLNVEFTSEAGGKKGKRFYEVTKTTVDNVEITDPSDKRLIDAKKMSNATITHILKRLVSEEAFKAMPRTNSWEGYLSNLVALVNKENPAFSEVLLDVFCHYQWQVGKDQTRSFPEIPRNMKQGVFCCLHVEPVGQWHQVVLEDPTDNSTALFYTDDAGNKHPFTRSGWFVKSNYFNRQTKAADDNDGYDYNAAPPADQADAAQEGVTW